MSIKIEVKSIEVTTKRGTSSKTGKPYSIREQVGVYAFLTDRSGNPNAYPTRISVRLEDEQAPYPLGTYQLAPASFYADRFGALSLGVLLQPLAASLSSQKAAA